LWQKPDNPRKNRWEIKKGKRNEPMDTWVLSVAASHHPELYLHKWKARDWERRAAMPAKPLPVKTEGEEETEQPSDQSNRGRRRPRVRQL
jgi:phage terminase large subunit GpA-like protein